ncbi:VOC family protein [Actinoplanes sp. TRM 88003]|uniref:VOC family protein n=1 Tax=Paractinoplanes aksuensis TaxID=2939490 RepID=A0ABT1E3K2_9ACTN|nr:VOC family protein [Actinoplanes aksuensis]MCO8277715.1 VOC family protein [Actinoplanes aksuensis]
MKLTSNYPVLMTRDVPGVAAFYQQHLGFEPTFTADWYVSLRRDRWELAVLDCTHETIPAAHRGRATTAVLLNFEVDDVDAEYHRLVTEGGLTVALDIRTEDFGQRHFILEAPDGVLLDIITDTEPTDEYAAQYDAGPVA